MSLLKSIESWIPPELVKGALGGIAGDFLVKQTRPHVRRFLRRQLVGRIIQAGTFAVAVVLFCLAKDERGVQAKVASLLFSATLLIFTGRLVANVVRYRTTICQFLKRGAELLPDYAPHFDTLLFRAATDVAISQVDKINLLGVLSKTQLGKAAQKYLPSIT